MVRTATAAVEPATAKGRATRRRILDAAAALMATRGVSEVSLDDVLTASSASKSQLYHYFPDRSGLVHAVIDEQRTRVLGFHQPHLDGLATWEDIDAWCAAIISAQAGVGCRGGCPLGSLANDLADRDEPARRQLSAAFSDWQAMLAAGLTQMIDAGALRTDADPDSLAVATIAALQGGLLLAEVEHDTRPLVIALTAAVAHLRCYATTPPD